MFYVLVFMLIGVLCGMLFNWLFRNRNISQTANIVLGVIGATVGGIIAVSYKPYDYNIVGEIFVATTGALVFLIIGNLLELAFNQHRIQ